MTNEERKKGSGNDDPDVPEVPNVECGGCGRWCFLEETPFSSIEEATDREYLCRICAKIEGVTEALQEMRQELNAEREKREKLEREARETVTLNTRLEEMVEAMRKAVEKREAEETGEGGRVAEVRLEEMQKELEIEREERGKLVVQLRELVVLEARLEEMEGRWRREAEQREVAQTEFEELKRKVEGKVQGTTGTNPAVEENKGTEPPVPAPRSGVRVQVTASAPKDVENQELVEPAAGEQQHGRAGTRRVLVIGSSNVSRCATGVASRVSGDDRVKVLAHPGKCMSEVMESAKDIVWENEQGKNLVIVHAGLNDVLNGRGHNLGRQIEAGVRKLRAVSEGVHILMCTIPEVEKQSVTTEKNVVAANRTIRQQGEKLGYEVLEVNKGVYQRGPSPRFERDGIHYGQHTGWRIGAKMGDRARVFLDPPRARK
ncbi:unnamed protein product [Ixodes pacificus]